MYYDYPYENKLMLPKILPSITTHGKPGSHWEDKLRELPILGIKEVALFVTGLSPDERTYCFGELEKVHAVHPFTIPFVHAVSSMQEYEYRYLQKVFKTQAFNLHPEKQYPPEYPLSADIRRSIFIENTEYYLPFGYNEIAGYAGMCVDVSHLEDTRRSCPELFPEYISFIEKIQIGANHISASFDDPSGSYVGKSYFSNHIAKVAEDFKYLKELPASVFGPLCAVEVENSLTEQLTFLPYIIEIIHSKFAAIESIQKAA